MKQAIKTTFNEFLTTNQLKVEELPQPIQDKISIFHDLYGQLEDTVEEDQDLLQGKLDELEDEIHEDLLNEFEEQLSHNEVIEEKQRKGKNEAILESLYQAGKIQNLSRSYLKSKGLEVNFSLWEIPVGSYLLMRNSVFTIRFRLVKK